VSCCGLGLAVVDGHGTAMMMSVFRSGGEAAKAAAWPGMR
jgi:hypothetical protein